MCIGVQFKCADLSRHSNLYFECLGGLEVYLSPISEFSDFLSNKDHALQIILDHLERVTLSVLDCNSIIFFEANENRELLMIGKSGISKLAEEELKAQYNLGENRPVSDAIKKGELIWLDPSPQRLEKYPALKDFPLLVDSHVLIVSPIFQHSTPVSAFVIISDTKMKANTEAEGFLKVISSIFSLYYYRTVVASPSEQKEFNHSSTINSVNGSSELTARQNVILRLISEDRTNSNISEVLGYSESTIRQEIMKIFGKLGSSTRKQAAEIFRKSIQD